MEENLKVILTKYHEKLGDVGDIVEVKAGYANNYLIPNDFALLATRGNMNQMELVKQAALKVEAKNIEEAEQFARQLEDLQVTFIVKTGEEGKLYGSITNKDIAEKIFKERKVEIDKKKVDLQEHIKELGEYDIGLKLYKEVKSSVKVLVEPDEESKELIETHKAEKARAEAEKKEKKQEEDKDKEKKEKSRIESKDKESYSEDGKKDRKKDKIRPKDKEK